MIVVGYGLFALLCAKVAWNLGVPYVLAARARRAGEGARGMSMAPMVEAVTLVLLVAVAAMSGEEVWILRPGTVGLVAAGLVVGSYVHLWLAGLVIGLSRGGRG